MRSFPAWALAVLLALLGLLALTLSRKVAVSEPQPSIVHGRVTDADGPVAEARVRFKGHAESILTDAAGQFVLPHPQGFSGHVTAAKAGYVIAGVQADSARLSLKLQRWPAADSEDYAWVAPGPDPTQPQNCAHCHADIYREWSAGAHARSASNRRFLNLYDGTDWHGRANQSWNLLADNPAGAGVCNACHAPTASFEDDLRRLTGVNALGVHCDFCHKIADAPRDHLGMAHGRYGLKLLRPAQGQFFLGPLDDVDRNEDGFSPLYRDSRYCASCHEGVVFGVHAYSTYSEWLDSPARREGKQCQTCHMAPTGRLTNFAPGKGGIARDPQTLASHRFPGGQLDMLRHCLKMTVRVDGPRAEVELRAEGVGHRVPTGFVDRNLLLIVEAFDATAKPIPLHSGPILPAPAGTLAGLPGKLYAKRFKDFHGAGLAPFWRADPEAADTRLVPGQADRTAFTFAEELRRVRVRLVYRRFWQEVARAKSWPDNEIILIDKVVDGG